MMGKAAPHHLPLGFMPYSTFQLQQVLCKNKKPGDEFSWEEGEYICLSESGQESNQPSLMAPSRAPRDTQMALASCSPEMTNAAQGLWDECQHKTLQEAPYVHPHCGCLQRGQVLRQLMSCLAQPGRQSALVPRAKDRHMLYTERKKKNGEKRDLKL